MKYSVTFTPDNVSIEVDQNATLYKAAKASGAYVLSSCGGKGNCGKCKVIIKQGETDSGKLYLLLVSGPNEVDVASVGRIIRKSLHQAEPKTIRTRAGFAMGGLHRSVIWKRLGPAWTRR